MMDTVSRCILAGLLWLAPIEGYAGEDRPISGAQVYANTCNRCHEFRSPVEFNDAQWSVIVTHMRVVAAIPADEARAVLGYLQANNNPPRLAPEPAPATLPHDASNPAALGKALTQSKGCVGCHALEGPGGTLGPPLDKVTLRRSKEFIRTQLLDPRRNNPQSLMPPLGLNAGEIDAILSYLATLN